MSGRTELYRECAAMGMTRAETARRCGVTSASVTYAATLHSIEFKLSKFGRPKIERPAGKACWSVSPQAIARYEARQNG